jgi:hypothetical protein
VLTTQGKAQGQKSRALSRTIQGPPKELRLTVKTRQAHANRAICECHVWAKDQGLWSEPRGPTHQLVGAIEPRMVRGQARWPAWTAVLGVRRINALKQLVFIKSLQDILE